MALLQTLLHFLILLCLMQDGGMVYAYETNAQPAPATGLFKGFGVLPQQAEKQTSGGNAGCLFRAFVYTNALLAK